MAAQIVRVFPLNANIICASRLSHAKPAVTHSSCRPHLQYAKFQRQSNYGFLFPPICTAQQNIYTPRLRATKLPLSDVISTEPEQQGESAVALEQGLAQ